MYQSRGAVEGPVCGRWIRDQCMGVGSGSSVWALDQGPVCGHWIRVQCVGGGSGVKEAWLCFIVADIAAAQ